MVNPPAGGRYWPVDYLRYLQGVQAQL